MNILIDLFRAITPAVGILPGPMATTLNIGNWATLGLVVFAGLWLAQQAHRRGWFSLSLRPKVAIDPYHRMQSIAEVQQAARAGVRLDVNRAGVDDWLRLPGISIHQARNLSALTQSGIQLYGVEDLAAALGVPLERVQPLTPVLQFCYYDRASGVQPVRLNPNQASLEMLSQIPGVDLYLARTIVQQRQTGGHYQNLTDLQQRLGLSPDLTAQLMHYLQF